MSQPSIQSRDALDAISTCEHCGCKLGLCECDQDYTELYNEFTDSIQEELLMEGVAIKW